MIKLAAREKTDLPRGSRYRLDCWLDRAVRFAPDDAQVSILYGFWLIKKGENALALEQFDKVRSAESRTPNIAYNLGLGYLEAREYEKALSAAHEAYAGGFNFPGLRSKLQKAGKWKDPVAEPAAKTAESAENAPSSPEQGKP
jgi:tetratricopeptide (TPR) repeat protein